LPPPREGLISPNNSRIKCSLVIPNW
jgi:hypothetical protein